MPSGACRLSVFAIAFGLSIAGNADAASMFNVTNLGGNYTLQQDASGTVQSVTSGDGARTYAFVKSPVTDIDQYVKENGGHLGDYSVNLLRNGADVTGVVFSERGSLPQPTFAPLNAGLLSGWYTYGSRTPPTGIDGSLPVADINARGEFVGKSLWYPNADNRTYAALTDPTGNLYGWNVPVSDNLNNYIASGLGINLTAAIKVDDLGQIIAQGTLNGAPGDFLLTPGEAPTPAPEPSALALLAIGATALGVRSARRRRKRLEANAARLISSR